jgi:hypothetical protein
MGTADTDGPLCHADDSAWRPFRHKKYPTSIEPFGAPEEICSLVLGSGDISRKPFDRRQTGLKHPPVPTRV